MLGWDQVGSLRAVIDGQGRVVKEIEYDAFGNILRARAPELKVPFGFAGGLHDRDTGLIRYRFRDYLPDVGRFTAKDPIGYKGGDSDLYGYCLDDPVNGIDPSGLRKSGWQNLGEGMAKFNASLMGSPAAVGKVYSKVRRQFPPALDDLYGDKGPYEETTVGDRLLHTAALSSRVGATAGSGYPGFSTPIFSVGGGVVGGVAGFNAGLATQGIAELIGHGREVYETSRKIRSYSDDDSRQTDFGANILLDSLGLLW